MRARRHGWLVWLVGMTLIGSTGCIPYFHPMPPVPGELATTHLPVTCAQQQHVHIFFINGVDPTHFGNLIGLCEHMRCQGYPNSYFGQLYHCCYFRKQMRRILAEDGEARFVLVGFSMGALPAYSLAQQARADGLPLDLVVLIAGKGVKHLRDRCPDQPIRVVDIVAKNCIWKGEFHEPADRVKEPDVYHFQAPTDYRTVDTLMRELATVAARVPVTMPAEPAPEEDDLSDMLKPVSELAPGRLGRPVFVGGEEPVH